MAQPKPTDDYAKRTIKYVESTLAELDPKQRSAYLTALHRYATEAMYLSFGAYRIKVKQKIDSDNPLSLAGYFKS